MKDISYDHLYRILTETPKWSTEKYLISIIIPVYNEENTIFDLLMNLPVHDKIEVIVIDDYSNDNTILEIEKAFSYRKIKLYKHKKNEGYGKAILTGIKRSHGKVILTMDSDGQHLPEDIYGLVKPILDGHAEYTIGSRYLGSFHYQLPISTRLGELLVELLLLILFNQRVKNNQGGFRAFNRDLMHIFDNIQYQSYAFTTELIIRAALYSYRIKECPIKLMDRVHGKSRIKLKKLAINIIFCFLRYFLLKVKMKMFKEDRIAFNENRRLLKEIK